MTFSTTAVHEVGHLWPAVRMGWDAYASVDGGAYAEGSVQARPPFPEPPRSDRSVPLLLRPDVEQRYLAGHALIAVGGMVAELLLGEGRVASPVSASVPEVLPGLADFERRELASYMNDEGAVSDTVRAAYWASEAHGDDVAAAGLWLSYLESVARSMLAADADLVLAAAEALARDGELSGAGVLLLEAA